MSIDHHIKIDPAAVSIKRYMRGFEPQKQNTVRIYKSGPERISIQIRGEKSFATVNLSADQIAEIEQTLYRARLELAVTESGNVECPHCHFGFAPSVIKQHIREKHDAYDYAADDLAFDAAREDRVFGKR